MSSNAHEGERSPFSNAGSAIYQADGTLWFFEYDVASIIHYRKSPPGKESTRHQLVIGGVPVRGSPSTPLAATLDHDKIYTSAPVLLKDVALPAPNGTIWTEGTIEHQKWVGYVNTSLQALGTRELGGQTDVSLRVFFNEANSSAKLTQGTKNDKGIWSKIVL